MPKKSGKLFENEFDLGPNAGKEFEGRKTVDAPASKLGLNEKQYSLYKLYDHLQCIVCDFKDSVAFGYQPVPKDTEYMKTIDTVSNIIKDIAANSSSVNAMRETTAKHLNELKECAKLLEDPNDSDILSHSFSNFISINRKHTNYTLDRGLNLLIDGTYAFDSHALAHADKISTYDHENAPKFEKCLSDLLEERLERQKAKQKAAESKPAPAPAPAPKTSKSAVSGKTKTSKSAVSGKTKTTSKAPSVKSSKPAKKEVTPTKDKITASEKSSFIKYLNSLIRENDHLDVKSGSLTDLVNENLKTMQKELTNSSLENPFSEAFLNSVKFIRENVSPETFFGETLTKQDFKLIDDVQSGKYMKDFLAKEQKAKERREAAAAKKAAAKEAEKSKTAEPKKSATKTTAEPKKTVAPEQSAKKASEPEIEKELPISTKKYASAFAAVLKDLRKTDSAFSKDSAEYKTFKTELFNAVKSLGDSPSVMVSEAFAKVQKAADAYRQAHMDVQPLSNRQIDRLKVMARLDNLCRSAAKHPNNPDECFYDRIAEKCITGKASKVLADGGKNSDSYDVGIYRRLLLSPEHMTRQVELMTVGSLLKDAVARVGTDHDKLLHTPGVKIEGVIDKHFNAVLRERDLAEQKAKGGPTL